MASALDAPAPFPSPPFLLIVDAGNVIEVFADFSGLGKDYAHFPDRQSFRITLDPQSLNPMLKSAEVTRDIAARLAKIAAALERRSHDPKDAAEFLMRCLFTMFAEDIGLIANKAFEHVLRQLRC